jgi:hypothetical protein
MKPLLTFLGALLMVSSSALATPTCTNGTLYSYELLNTTGGCEINNLLFDNFSDQESAAGSSVALTASEITVTPDSVFLDEGLQFSASWNVSTPSSLDSAISFTVQTVNGAATLDDISLSATETQTGNGNAGVIESYCVGSLKGAGNHCPSALQTIAVSDPPANNNGPVTQTYGLTNELSVTKDIDVAAGANTVNGAPSTASISVVSNNYSQIGSVPEPISFVLVGAGLLGVGLMRKRSRR